MDALSRGLSQLIPQYPPPCEPRDGTARRFRLLLSSLETPYAGPSGYGVRVQALLEEKKEACDAYQNNNSPVFLASRCTGAALVPRYSTVMELIMYGLMLQHCLMVLLVYLLYDLRGRVVHWRLWVMCQ